MARSGRDLLDELRGTVPEVSAADAIAAVGEAGNGTPGPVLLDVREADEVSQGRAAGAIHIPRGFLELKIDQAIPDRDADVYVYCAAGSRSLFAAKTLHDMGYARAKSVIGGFKAWKEADGRTETPQTLAADDRARYQRHLSIPQVGEDGQLKLLSAKVLMIGAGGLGSPAAFYLAAAGVGTIGIVDFDVVDESNLQRQILHTADRIGTPKVDSAKRALTDLNTGITVNTYNERLTSENIVSLFEDYDIIVDGCDNFPTRYLVNDACVLLQKPNVHGSVYQFEGQATVFWPGHGPCYRCLYPEPPPPEMAPSCAEAGVLGVLPGVIGLIEAVETIKLILGIGDDLCGRLLTYDALRQRFRELKLQRDPNCPYCADGREFPGFVDYEHFCGLGS